jgi:PAS domain S-box-containing protein
MSSPKHRQTPLLALSAEAILGSIADPFFALDREENFAYINMEAERLLQRPRSELAGRNIWNEFPEAVGSTFYKEYRRAIQAGLPVQFEEFYAPLGRWFEVRAYPSESHLLVYFHDATRRRREQEAVRLSRERLEQTLGSVDLGLWFSDLPFKHLAWNDKTKEHFWLPPDVEVTIDLFYERLHPHDRERTRRAIEQAISEHGIYDTEYRTVAPDGQAKWIRAIGNCFYNSDGTPVRLDGVTVDITAQKRLLAQEQESRLESETLNRISRALSAELDLRTLVDTITNAATNLTGAQFGAFYNAAGEGESYMLAGTRPEALDRSPIPRDTRIFATTLRGEGVVRYDDIPRNEDDRSSAGDLSLRSYLSVPVISRSGEVLGGLFFGHAEPGVFTDNHERSVIALASQAATAIDNARLFEAAERARQEAQDAARALSNSNAELQQVAYVAAHDLQEPLRSIASFSQLLERRYREKAGAPADDLVQRIMDAVKRMQMLLHDLLQYTSLSSDDSRPSGSTDMNWLVASCLDGLAPAIREREAEITVGPLPVIAPANAGQVEQLLLNLLSNALKYARPGVPPCISITSESAPPMCKFSVKDNGEGFAPEYSEHIFGMFKRLHGYDVPGTGIGLALCRRIVEVHGGRIWAESAPGEGATIHFTLPCGTSRDLPLS